MYLIAHQLHSVPFNKLNRDGLGSPKSAVYGGVQRARVSSQAWKRPVRTSVEATIGENTVRTRHIASAVADRLTTHRGWDADTARKAGRAVLIAADAGATRRGSKKGGLKPTHREDTTGVMLWLPETALTEVTELCLSHQDAIADTPLPTLNDKGEPVADDKQPEFPVVLPAEQVDDALKSRTAMINLFGRFLADIPDHRVDGAVQVAHAIGVHESIMDFDFFTAVDDVDTGTGAGHMGTQEYTSATFYRYTAVNLHDFAANLGTDLDDALRYADLYLRAFAREMPTGKQNVTGATTPPDLVHLQLRSAPLNLAGAFEEPIQPGPNGGYVRNAVSTFHEYVADADRMIADQPAWSGHVTRVRGDWDNLGQPYTDLDELIQAATAAAVDHDDNFHQEDAA